MLSRQVFVPLLAHLVRPQVSEDRPGGHPGLGLQSAQALQSLVEGEHDGMNAAVSALLTPGGMGVLRRSAEELVRVIRAPVVLETPRLIWGPACREELEEMLKQVTYKIREDTAEGYSSCLLSFLIKYKALADGA